MMQRPMRIPVSDRASRWLSDLGFGSLLVALLLIAGGLLVGFVRLTWTEHQINQSIARQEAANQAHRDANIQLKGLAEYSESDAAVEQAARDRLGMARDGETILRPNIVLPPPPTVPPAQPAPAPLQPQPGTEGLAVKLSPSTAANVHGWWHALFPGANVRP